MGASRLDQVMMKAVNIVWNLWSSRK